MRKRLRLLLLALVVIALGVVGTLVGRLLWMQSKVTLVQKGIEMLPGVVQRIQNFRRIKVVDDRRVWEVSAEDAQYYEAEKMVVIERAAVQVYLEDGRGIGLEGKQGRVHLEGKEIQRVELDGGIHATMADYSMQAENAVYDQTKNAITVPGRVSIHATGLDLSGEEMEVDLTAKKVRLNRQVKMSLNPEQWNADVGSRAPL